MLGFLEFNENVKQGMMEGVMKTIKRGLQGWRKGDNPKEIRRLAKDADDTDIKGASRIHTYIDNKFGSSPEHSPVGFNRKVIDREMKKRGLGEQGVAEETDKDLPFTPDKKKTKPSTPGKYGSAYSTVRNLARQALEKQKQVKEEEQLDEKSAQARANKARKNVMDAGRGIAYRQKTGVNLQPKDTGHDSYQAMNKALGRQLRREEIEEELQEGAQSHKVNVTVSDPNHTAVSQRNEKQLKRVVVNATDKGDALAKAQAFYKKKGYKVHDVEHHSVVPKTTMKTEETDIEEGLSGSLSKSDYMPGAVRHDLSNIKSKKTEPYRDPHRPVADIDPDWEKEQAKKRKKQGVTEGYRGNSEADKPFFAAQDHKKAAEKARKSGDHFSYHKHMSAHHDAMEQWNSNKGRTHVANQHAMKADEHEDYAQQARKGSK